MRISLPRSAPSWITDPVVNVLSRTGITPNVLSALGLIGNVVAAVLAANGEFLAAGVVVLLASSLDMFDGALARATGQATRFGSAFDATLDRVSEAAVLFGLLWYFSDKGGRTEELLIFVAMTGSFLVSYIRARAEIIGVPLREGFFTRFERVVIVAGALILTDLLDENLITPMLWVLAALASFTAVQRLVMVWLKTRNDEPQ